MVVQTQETQESRCLTFFALTLQTHRVVGNSVFPSLIFLFDFLMPPAANLQDKNQVRENYCALGMDVPQFLANQRGSKLMISVAVGSCSALRILCK